MEDLYGDPLAIWRDWADDVHGQSVDCGHHISSFGRGWVGHLGTNSFGRQAWLVAGELMPPDAFQVRLRGYVSRSVRTFPFRPRKEPSLSKVAAVL